MQLQSFPIHSISFYDSWVPCSTDTALLQTTAPMHFLNASYIYKGFPVRCMPIDGIRKKRIKIAKLLAAENCKAARVRNAAKHILLHVRGAKKVWAKEGVAQWIHNYLFSSVEDWVLTVTKTLTQ